MELRLGTRGSPLALRQAEWVAERLRAADRQRRVEIRKIRTSGDRLAGRSLARMGGKGLFIKEIEEALLAGRVDIGVHSMKDLPVALPEGLAIAAVPPREDARDVLIAPGADGLAGLKSGMRVGTASLRRRALVRHARPDVEIVPLRGNVETRIAKWRAGEVDALVVAQAGLRRLGLDLPDAHALSAEEFLPAIGQGALALEAAPDNRWWGAARALDDPSSCAAVRAERAFLRAVGGDCNTPVAAHAVIEGGELHLRAMITDPDGARLVRGERSGRREEAEAVGRALGEELLSRGGREILESLPR